MKTLKEGGAKNSVIKINNTLIQYLKNHIECKKIHEQNIKILNKHGTSITDFFFCLRFKYGSTQHSLLESLCPYWGPCKFQQTLVFWLAGLQVLFLHSRSFGHPPAYTLPQYEKEGRHGRQGDSCSGHRPPSHGSHIWSLALH